MLHFNFDRTFNIKTINFLGQSISIKYRIGVSNGKAINQIIISSKIGEAKFGNDGTGFLLLSANHGVEKTKFAVFQSLHSLL